MGDSEETLLDVDALDADFAALNQVCLANAETDEIGPSPDAAPDSNEQQLPIADSNVDRADDLTLCREDSEETLLDVDADFPDLDQKFEISDPALRPEQRPAPAEPRRLDGLHDAANVFPEHFVRGSIHVCNPEPLQRMDTTESNWSCLEV